MVEPSILNALRLLTTRLDKKPVNWAVTASCSLALQGVPVDVHDIDLLTDQAGAYRLQQLFAAEMSRPVQFSARDITQSHYGAFWLAGYEFEILGDMQYRDAGGNWDRPIDFTPHKHFMQVDGMTVPVLMLEYEYENYVRLGRVAKVTLLGEWLAAQGRQA